MKKLVLCFWVCSYFLPLLAGEIETLNILHTTDIHSHIFGEESGWLRTATLIKKLRSKAGGEKNSLLIDCGDTLSGSVLGAISNGQASAVLLNALEYDAWIIGNHDFELGSQRLTELCESVKADKFAGNIDWRPDLFKKYRFYEKKGLKIALIGLTSPHLEEWLWQNDEKQYKITSLLEAMANIMPEVMAGKPDFIILALHHGRFSPTRLKGVELSRVVEKYPQIDLVLGGHSHQEIAGEKIGPNTWYVLAGPYGKSLAQVFVQFDKETKDVVGVSSCLHLVSSQIPPDDACRKEVSKWQEQTINFQKGKIGFTPKPISGTELDKLLAAAIMETARVQAAFFSRPVPGTGFNGSITGGDVFKVEPYDDTVCVLQLTSSEINDICREQSVKKEMGRFQRFYLLTKLPKNKDKRIAVAFSSYVLAGAGGRLPKLKKIARKKECKGYNTRIPVRDALLKYLKKKK